MKLRPFTREALERIQARRSKHAREVAAALLARRKALGYFCGRKDTAPIQ